LGAASVYSYRSEIHLAALQRQSLRAQEQLDFIDQKIARVFSPTPHLILLRIRQYPQN
jgi:hypothetical protein